MIRGTLAFSLLLMAAASALAQGSDCGVFPYSAIYVEGAGTAGLGSVNYERTFTAIGRARIHGRAGIGFIHLRDFTRRFNPDIVVPLGIMATDRRTWNPEVGCGITFTSIVYPDDRNFDPERRGEIQFWWCAGVRSVPGRWLFRANYTPVIEFGDWRHWGGLSIGRKL